MLSLEIIITKSLGIRKFSHHGKLQKEKNNNNDKKKKKEI